MPICVACYGLLQESLDPNQYRSMWTCEVQTVATWHGADLDSHLCCLLWAPTGEPRSKSMQINVDLWSPDCGYMAWCWSRLSSVLPFTCVKAMLGQHILTCNATCMSDFCYWYECAHTARVNWCFQILQHTHIYDVNINTLGIKSSLVVLKTSHVQISNKCE